MSDRVLVMYRGQVRPILPCAAAVHEAVLGMATGVGAAA